jgi:hypothetical protein
MYDLFGSVAAAKRHYRRARSFKSFILEPCPKRAPKCAVCGNPVNVFEGVDERGAEIHPEGYRSNRCEYNPRSREVVAYHYVCRWNAGLQQLFSMRHK